MSIVIDYTKGFFEASPAGETVGDISTGTLDLSSGNVFSDVPAANVTYVFSNPPASGTAYGFTLKVTGTEVTETYDIVNASYDSVSLDLRPEGTAPNGLHFKPDGTKMYVSEGDSDSIYQYTLSTAWDLSTASYDSVSFSVASQTVNPREIHFKSDGTKMYIASTNPDEVFQYTLSTAWDLSTASYDSVSFSVSSEEGLPWGLHFKTDGTKMYVSGASSDSIYQYTLSTAWDLSTASYDSVSFSVSSEDGNIRALGFKPDGTKMYISGLDSDSIHQYTLSTAWDLSTASYDSVSFSVASEDSDPTALAFKDDGSKMFVGASSIFTTGGFIYQYSTSSIFTPTVTYPTSVAWPSGTAPDAPAIGETNIYTFYTQDGGTTYYGFLAGGAMA